MAFVIRTLVSLFFLSHINAVSAAEYWTEGNQETRSGGTPGAKIDITALNSVFTALAEKLSPSVVNVYTKTRIKIPDVYGPGLPEDLFPFFFGNPFGERVPPAIEQEAQSLGSGFILNKDGYIVTNSHVVRLAGKTAEEIMVKFLREERGKGFAAKVVGVDERSDVALLKLKAAKSGLIVAPLGDSEKAKVGEWVIAIGNPYGHAHTVTQGIVSALGRNLDNTEAEFIQTSASINPGNSGGPLFNLYGEVIGINTAIDPRAQGIGFATPITPAKRILLELIKTGRVKRGWVGVMIAPISDEIADALGLSDDIKGVLVRGVVKDGPADKAGLRKGDIITRVGKEAVTGPEKLVQTVGSLKSGDKIPFEILRHSKKLTLSVRIGDEPKGAKLKGRED